MGQASRLALVSKVLCDRELIELRQENEKLKLKLFWKEHGIRKLKTWLVNSNLEGINPPGCECTYCHQRSRNKEVRFQDGVKCDLYIWFLKYVEECGCTVMDHRAAIRLENVRNFSHDCLDYEYSQDSIDTPSAYNVDAHFVFDSYLDLSYGSRLLNATSVNDPELKKLEKVFDMENFDDGVERYNSDDD